VQVDGRSHTGLTTLSAGSGSTHAGGTYAAQLKCLLRVIDDVFEPSGPVGFVPDNGHRSRHEGCRLRANSGTCADHYLARSIRCGLTSSPFKEGPKIKVSHDRR
jgi:hypothetical protein